jgi:hypothetical protein
MRRIALAALLAIAGCANPIQPLPESWPAILPSAGCPNLAGSYENVGATSGKFGAALSWFLMPSNDPATRKHLEGAYRIEIVGDADREMDVSAWRRNAFVARRTLKRGVDYRCEAGEVQLSLPSHGAHTLQGAALGRAADLSLIARTSSVEVGLAYYIVPYALPSRVWARFETLPR